MGSGNTKTKIIHVTKNVDGKTEFETGAQKSQRSVKETIEYEQIGEHTRKVCRTFI